MTLVIGITGSIAVGKSTVTNYLLNKGYCVLDADKISHTALDKGSSCYYKVIDLFDCALDDGNIDRKKLGNIVFNDALKKEKLESIIHPYVIDRLKEGIKDCHDDMIFLDIPLLYEAHLEYLCDKIIVVYIDEDLQIKRLMERNHIDEEAARLLISNQISIEDKKKIADYVIDNRGYFEVLYKHIDDVLGVIKDENLFK